MDKDRVINFIKYKWFAIGLSSILLAVFSIGVYYNGGFNWGIDFSGGVKITAQFEEGVTPHQIREALEGSNIGAEVQQIGKEELNQYVIATKLLEKGESSEKSSQLVSQALGEKFRNIQVMSVETVGPAVGNFLKQSMLKLGIVAVILMMLYLAFRFEMKYSVGVMTAVLHDVILSIFFCGIMGIEINIPIVAAILTLFGFSVNDTIVIFDRVRENLQIKTKQTFTYVLDLSITQTLSRTVITTLTVLFCVLTLYLIGEGTISDFALVMLFGLILGTYSTIYIASPVVIWWEKLTAK